MRKFSLISIAMLIVSIPTFAGDYLTNTNQNAAFLRMIARGASIDVDGVYSNPAGLAFLPKDGLCTKFFFMCNIIVPLRPKTIKKDLDEKIFVD